MAPDDRSVTPADNSPRTRRFNAPNREDMQLDTLPALLRMSEVTALLDCHERTVRLLVAAGDLPGFRFGREFRFKREDVLALLKPVPSAATAS